MNKVETLFQDKALYSRYGTLIFSKTDALDLIDALENHQIDILGVDGFIIREDNLIQPSMEHSISFCDFTKKSTDTWQAARKFTNDQSTALNLEIVCS